MPMTPPEPVEPETVYDTMSDADLMDRVRAARAMSEAKPDAQRDMYAFLSLFHPDMSHAEKMQLAMSVERRR